MDKSFTDRTLNIGVDIRIRVNDFNHIVVRKNQSAFYFVQNQHSLYCLGAPNIQNTLILTKSQTTIRSLPIKYFIFGQMPRQNQQYAAPRQCGSPLIYRFTPFYSNYSASMLYNYKSIHKLQKPRFGVLLSRDRLSFTSRCPHSTPTVSRRLESRAAAFYPR